MEKNLDKENIETFNGIINELMDVVSGYVNKNYHPEMNINEKFTFNEKLEILKLYKEIVKEIRKNSLIT